MQNNNVTTPNVQLNLQPVIRATAVTVIAMTLFSFWAWAQLPEGAQIPVHWNAYGEVDRYGSIFEGLFLIPLVTAGVALLLWAIPKIDPRRINIAQSAKAYRATWAGLLIFMAIMHVSLVLNALGYPINIGMVVPVLVGILFLVIGNYMGKIRSNFMFGIRTPWTLSSDLSWNKTHRLGGRLFMVIGLLMIATVFLPAGPLWVFVLLGSIFSMVALLFVYSYLVYRSDPQNQS